MLITIKSKNFVLSARKMWYYQGFVLIILLLILVVNDGRLLKEEDIEQSRVYFLKKVNGAGCPYTASWLVHLNLYRKVTWYLDITKMEAATFNM